MNDADDQRAPGLPELQRIQQAFDEDRGLDFGSAGERDDAWLHAVEFATLGMIGELGELANNLKKARRARWTGRDPEAALAAAGAETGDVLAYLMKLSNLLELDLAETYLEKMSDNCLRFPPPDVPGDRGRVITVSGPPGSGKTTLVRRLGERFTTHVERWDQNPALRRLLDQVRDFTSQAPSSETVVLDQDPAATVRVYGRYFLETGELGREGYHDLVRRLLEIESVLAQWSRGRIVIMLDAEPETLRWRLAGKNGSSTHPPEFITDIRERFHALAGHIRPALTLMTDESDPDALTEQVLALVADYSAAP